MLLRVAIGARALFEGVRPLILTEYARGGGKTRNEEMGNEKWKLEMEKQEQDWQSHVAKLSLTPQLEQEVGLCHVEAGQSPPQVSSKQHLWPRRM